MVLLNVLVAHIKGGLVGDHLVFRRVHVAGLVLNHREEALFLLQFTT